MLPRVWSVSTVSMAFDTRAQQVDTATKPDSALASAQVQTLHYTALHCSVWHEGVVCRDLTTRMHVVSVVFDQCDVGVGRLL